MPRNSSGTCTNPLGPFIAGISIVATEVNTVNSDIYADLTDSLSRSGKGGLTANMNAGGFRITNLQAGNASGHAVEYDQFNTQISAKAASGANTDITSLNAPALGAATATTQATTDDSTKVATTAFVQDIADLLCPPGTILPFAGNTVPAGFLEVPTTATTVSRTTYARLFAAIGTLWGAGDGSTTFGIPYLETDYTWLQTGAGAVGSVTTGEVIAHSHSYSGPSGSGLVGGGGTAGYATTLTTTSTGGTANKAAGRRVKFMVKY